MLCSCVALTSVILKVILSTILEGYPCFCFRVWPEWLAKRGKWLDIVTVANCFKENSKLLVT
ncbi:hypothetical protein BFRIPC_00031 (plasmid) [Peribacillus frigoritolerans]